MALFTHTYRNDEFEIDGAIINTDIVIAFEYAYDQDGPYFRRMTNAHFMERGKTWGAMVPEWLEHALERWCQANEAMLTETVADEASRSDDFAPIRFAAE